MSTVLQATQIKDNKIYFTLPKITDVKYGGYTISDYMSNVSSNASSCFVDGTGYIRFNLWVKNNKGVYENVLYTYGSSIDDSKDVILRYSDIRRLDIGTYLNKNYPSFYLEVTGSNSSTFKLEYDTIPTIEFDYAYALPNLNSVVLTKNHDKKEYTLTIDSSLYTSYHVDVVKVNYDGNGNDKVSHSYDTKAKDSIIKYSYLNEGENRLDITIYHHDKEKTHTKQFIHYTPSISDLTANNADDMMDSTTFLTWESENQEKAKIFVNDVLIDTIEISKSYIVPKNALIEGKNTITVTVVGISDKGVVGVAEASKSTTITLSRIKPTINNVTIDNKNTDEKITLSWTSENQSYYAIYADETLLTTQKNTGKQFTFKEGTISPKTQNLIIRVYYNSGFDTIYTDYKLEVDLYENTPAILNLEPSDRTINIEEAINVSFETNSFCDRWVLVCNDKFTCNGTTDKNIYFTSNTFKKGTNTMKLTVYYSPKWSNGTVTRKAEKIVTFTGYGTPLSPILTTKEVYSSSSPNITWELNDEQVGYEYELYIGNTLITTNDELSKDNYFKLADLVDKTTYTINIRIKNKYNLYSKWTTATFKTEFNDILLPNFFLVEGENCVHITINGYQEATFKEISIYRKQGYSDWVEIANKCNIEDSITDYTCPCNIDLYYKVRVYDTSNSYRDTEAKVINVSLNNYWLTNLEDFTKAIRMDFVESDEIYNTDFVYKIYSNQSSPRVFKGNTNYRTINLEVQFPNNKAYEFENFIQNSNDYNAFCYRNWKGERKFVNAVLTNKTPINSQVVKFSVTLTEINFTEVEMYSGSGFRKIVYLNGEYFLDGSVDLSGYDDNYVIEEVD